jgi:type III restriction enzyme
VKLPSWFTIDTPIGSYNPDWAFVTESEEKLYFVRETKGTLDSEERRSKENHRDARCGYLTFRGSHVIESNRENEHKRRSDPLLGS